MNASTGSIFLPPPPSPTVIERQRPRDPRLPAFVWPDPDELRKEDASFSQTSRSGPSRVLHLRSYSEYRGAPILGVIEHKFGVLHKKGCSFEVEVLEW